MKKIPVLVSIALIAGVALSLAFTQPIQSVNGVVRSYSPGASLTVHTDHGDFVYLLRPATLMWGWGATSWSGGIANTGGNASSSNSSGSSSSSSGSSSSSSGSSSSSSATATATMAPTATTAPSPTPAATSTPTSGSSSGSSSSSSSSGSASGTTGGTAVSNVNGLGAGARVTVFGVCYSNIFSRRGINTGLGLSHKKTSSNGMSTGNNSDQGKVCLALAVIVRGPSAGTIANTGGANATSSATSSAAGTSSPTAAATTETPTAAATETPAVTMTPTP